MSTLTKEWLLKTIAELEEERDAVPGAVNEDAARALAAMKIAQASLEAEPVAWDYELASYITCEGPQNFKRIVEREAPPEWAIDEGRARNIVPLYTAPPAPVSVPNGRAITQHFDTIALETARGIMCDVNRRHEFLGGEVQLLSRIQCRIDDACRAAMLQGAEPVTTANKLGNSPVIPDGLRLALSNAGIAAPGSDEMLAATCEKYIQALVTWVKDRKPFRSAVIPDGWVACSERMPSAGEQVLAYRPDAPESNDPLIKMATYVGGSAHGHGFDCYCKPTHWMPLPAAPQQEA
ncbi:DUF551 domain-containing protein [Enterobacter hormaechei]|uniref:DUF551 domain-containing protein n=1 Tax=Enterobacter hormaechei TaxID=158836 RepID=UPI003D6DDDA7